MTFNLGWRLRGHFKVTKVKLERRIFTVAPRPMVHIDKNVHRCPLSKSTSWPLTLNDLSRSFEGHECETGLSFSDGARQTYGYYGTLLGSWHQRSRIRNDLRPWLTFKRSFQGHERETRAVAPRPMVPINKNVHRRPLSKSASWPLTLKDLSRSSEGHECESRLNLSDDAR